MNKVATLGSLGFRVWLIFFCVVLALTGQFAERSAPLNSAKQQRESGMTIEDIKGNAAAGESWAQFRLGAYYASGKNGLPKNEEEAVRWYRRSAEQGVAEGQFFLGQALFLGKGTDKNEAEALSWCEKAAAQGFAPAQYWVGVALAQGECGLSKDIPKGVGLVRKAALQGHTEAQVVLAKAYLNGSGVARDPKEAVVWYRKAAEAGDAKSQLWIGSVYLKGYRDAGVQVDETQGEKWLLEAARQGEATAHETLGRYLFAKGNHLRPLNDDGDWSGAFQWWVKAARMGHAEAQFWVSAALEKGKRGVKMDEKQAGHWLEEAAQRGYVPAQMALGDAYKKGTRGIKRNYVEAYKWFKLVAGSQGYSGPGPIAATAAVACQTEMTTDELSEAMRKVADFKPRTGLPVAADDHFERTGSQ